MAAFDPSTLEDASIYSVACVSKWLCSFSDEWIVLGCAVARSSAISGRRKMEWAFRQLRMNNDTLQNL